VTDTYDDDAFGSLISQTGTTPPNNYRCAGEPYDPDLGLDYNRARYLDVRSGRFWGMDTFEGDSNSPASIHIAVPGVSGALMCSFADGVAWAQMVICVHDG